MFLYESVYVYVFTRAMTGIVVPGVSGAVDEAEKLLESSFNNGVVPYHSLRLMTQPQRRVVQTVRFIGDAAVRGFIVQLPDKSVPATVFAIVYVDPGTGDKDRREFMVMAQSDKPDSRTVTFVMATSAPAYQCEFMVLGVDSSLITMLPVTADAPRVCSTPPHMPVSAASESATAAVAAATGRAIDRPDGCLQLPDGRVLIPR